jgi:hypothetical protein
MADKKHLSLAPKGFVLLKCLKRQTVIGSASTVCRAAILSKEKNIKDNFLSVTDIVVNFK